MPERRSSPGPTPGRRAPAASGQTPRPRHAGGDQPADRGPPEPLGSALVLDPDHPGDGQATGAGRGAPPAREPDVASTLHQDYGPNVHYITYPWSNERRTLRTLSEHLYSPLRLPFRRIDVLNTLMAPIVNPTWSLVIHMKTMHAFTAPEALAPAARAYRRMNYPRSARVADAIIINSDSLRSEIERYLDVDPRKLKLIYEAVDHDLFKPGDAALARSHVAKFGVTKPFVLFVSSLWRYKNCDGLLRAWVTAREQLRGRQLAIVGHGRDEKYAAELRALQPSSASPRTSSSSAVSRSKRPPASTRRPKRSSTRRSTRPSASPSSRRWRAAVRS